MTAVLLPLYSNMSWFVDEDSVSRLERQIKSYLILYDELYVEAGRLHIAATANGQGLNFFLPSRMVPEGRREIEFVPRGQPFSFHVQDPNTGSLLPLLSGASDVTYEVDYHPILQKAGLLNVPYVKLIDIQTQEAAKRAFETHASALIQSPDIRGELPENAWVAKQTLFGLLRDTSIAAESGMALSASGRLLPVINWQRNDVAKRWYPDIPGIFFDHWLELECPDLTEASWDEVCEFRESPQGQSFRGLVRQLKSRAVDLLKTGPTHEDIRYWVSKEFSKEQLRELRPRVKSPRSVLLSFCLNLIPYSQLIGTTKDLLDCLHDHSSWISLANAKSPRKD